MRCQHRWKVNKIRCGICHVDKQVAAAAQELIKHPEKIDDIIAPIVGDVFADRSVNQPFAVFKSRIRRIEALLGKAIPREHFYKDSVAVFHRQSPPEPVQRYNNDNVVPRVNGGLRQ